MKAETRTLQELFQGDRQFVVPVFQRPYVWEREKQWEPLWNDIEATAVRLAEARQAGFHAGKDAPSADQGAAPHFLGAVVIEDQPVMTGDVDTRLVVDGQQRLTTLQLLLRGTLDALEESNVDAPLQARIRKVTRNDGEVVPEERLLKVAPRDSERDLFEIAMGDGEDQSTHFSTARDFFASSAAAYLADDEVPRDPFGQGPPENDRAALLVATLLGLVKLVVIDLEDADDAQVIFEALNARNTPLSATDLVKNLVFMRARAEGQSAGDLYEERWRRFDDDSDWWLEVVGVGHAQRARQDWLLGDWLIAQRAKSINVGRLYGEFRQWLDESSSTALEALATLDAYADAYEVLHGRRPGASERELEAVRRIDDLNITAAMPVLLWLFVQDEGLLSPDEREQAVLAVESFVVRRMAAKFQTRGYGLAFVEILKIAQGSDHPGRGVIEALKSGPNRYEWPTLEDLQLSFETSRYYGSGGINQGRLRMLLGGIDGLLQQRARKSETAEFDYDVLQVEHVIPQSWAEHWPVSEIEPSAKALAEQERERHVNRIGNLTLVTGELNPSMGKDPWESKRVELGKHSKLELNARLVEESSWDEEQIVKRGRWLAELLDEVWPGPNSFSWNADDRKDL
jgi:hypothetical protein